MISYEPERPYDPDRVALNTKIERHLRRKKWKKSRESGKWLDPSNLSEHSLTAAVRIQMHKEGWEE